MLARFLPLLFVAIAIGPNLAGAIQDAQHHDWVVSRDTTLSGTTREIAGNVTVASGARLTMEGSHLRIGGVLHIQRNASLELLPSTNEVASSLSAHPGGAHFWIRVDGTMTGLGGPNAEIRDLSGDGLSSTLTGTGGIQVFGHMELEDYRVYRGTGGIFVGMNASTRLIDSAVHNLGEVGITALGSLTLRNSTVGDTAIGVVGKDTCDIQIEQTAFEDMDAEQLLVNGCRANVSESQFIRGGVAIVANNAANVTIRDTVVRDHAIDGLGSYGTVQGGVGLFPTVRFFNVSMHPGPSAQRGADIESAALVEFVNVTFSGHASHGIRAKQAVLSIRDSSIEANGGNGIVLVGGYFRDDPLQAGNDFGDLNDGTLNGQAAISHLAVVRAWGVDGHHQAVPGATSLEVYRTHTDEPVDILQSRDLEGIGTEIVFEAYSIGVDGQPAWLGPFRYEASHSADGAVHEGELDLSGPILLSVQQPRESGWAPFGQLLLWLILVAGGLLIAGGLRRSAQERKKRN